MFARKGFSLFLMVGMNLNAHLFEKSTYFFLPVVKKKGNVYVCLEVRNNDLTQCILC